MAFDDPGVQHDAIVYLRDEPAVPASPAPAPRPTRAPAAVWTPEPAPVARSGSIEPVAMCPLREHYLEGLGPLIAGTVALFAFTLVVESPAAMRWSWVIGIAALFVAHGIFTRRKFHRQPIGEWPAAGTAAPPSTALRPRVRGWVMFVATQAAAILVFHLINVGADRSAAADRGLGASYATVVLALCLAAVVNGVWDAYVTAARERRAGTRLYFVQLTAAQRQSAEARALAGKPYAAPRGGPRPN